MPPAAEPPTKPHRHIGVSAIYHWHPCTIPLYFFDAQDTCRPDLKNDPRYLQAPRALGESVIVEGVTIKVTQSDASGDTVEITK